MTEKEAKSCEQTVVLLRQLAFNIHGFMDVVDEANCEKIIKLLKEQEIEEPHPWDHLWTAPDGTFKGRCDNCGFVHFFIEGHVTQYKFCPQCGEQKMEL